MIKGFRDFLMRGNVIDLAVGVIMGTAFGAIVASLVADIITPIIGLIFGSPDFSGIRLFSDASGEGGIGIGNFINALIAFLFTATGVYFFIVVPMNQIKKMAESGKKPADAPPPPRQEVLLEEIRNLLAKGR
ncbi:MAG: large conductance mechanosensitive channel protein MscL [Trueperaceae bacterium]